MGSPLRLVPANIFMVQLENISILRLETTIKIRYVDDTICFGKVDSRIESHVNNIKKLISN